MRKLIQLDDVDQDRYISLSIEVKSRTAGQVKYGLFVIANPFGMYKLGCGEMPEAEFEMMLKALQVVREVMQSECYSREFVPRVMSLLPISEIMKHARRIEGPANRR